MVDGSYPEPSTLRVRALPKLPQGIWGLSIRLRKGGAAQTWGTLSPGGPAPWSPSLSTGCLASLLTHVPTASRCRASSTVDWMYNSVGVKEKTLPWPQSFGLVNSFYMLSSGQRLSTPFCDD